MKKAILLDVSAMIYRAYFSLMNMRNSKGEPTGAVYGFANMLMGVIDEFQSEYICAAYDVKRTSLKRSEKFQGYKADRKPMPDDLLKQMPLIEKLISAFGISSFRVEGYEADDVLGTLAKKFSELDIETYIVTGDKDLSQVIDKNINIALLGKGEGKSRFKIIATEEDVIEQLGVRPHEVPDLFGLIGDSSDGIPGVRKVGEKKAVPMLQKYINLEGIYANLDKLTEISGIGKGLVKNIEEDKELAFLSRELAIIKCDLDIHIDIDKLKLQMDKNTLLEILEDLEMKSLIKKLSLANLESDTNDKNSMNSKEKKIENTYKRIVLKKEDEVEILKKSLNDSKKVAVFYNKIGFAFCTEKSSYYIPLKHSYIGAVNFSRDLIQEIFDLDVEFIAYKFKDILNDRYNIKNINFDINLAHYLLTTNTREQLESIVEAELGEKLKTYEEVFAKLELIHTDINIMAQFSFERVEAIYKMQRDLKEKLEKAELSKLYFELELPLLRVLSNMERSGIKIDIKHFTKYQKELSGKLNSLIPLIYKEARDSIKANYDLLEISEFNIIEKYQELASLMYKKKSDLNLFNKSFDSLSVEEILAYKMEFNIASPKQIGIVFFDLMKMPVIKKTKSGFSVDEEVLEELKNRGHKIAEYMLEHRKLTKLLSTYVEALPKLTDKNHRIHTNYNQSGTATGRLSSSEPNLQNIPSRTDEGMKIREGFIPKEGYSLLAFDYSQIELRVLAELSKDENLIDAYEKDIDLHSLTAKKLFNLDEYEEISREQRAIAKIVNFSIIYGKTAFGLAKELGISNEEAKLYIERYFEQYPRVKELENKILEDARDKSYVRTMFGRRRIIPELKSTNKNIKQQGERMAVNTVIQGSAADILKIVMVKLHEVLKEKEDIFMLLQVHDELLFEVENEKLEEYIGIIRDIMENTIKLENIKLKTNIAYGKNWSEAK